MTVLHRIHIPGGKQPEPIPSPIGQWESAAGEVHEFYEPMMQLTVSIDDDHTLHLFCEAGQVERVPGVLMELVRRGFRMRAEATLAMLDELVDGVEGRP
jgi:hypothetical protein